MWIWEWRCHGWLWELIAARRHDGADVLPRCPTCKRKLKLRERQWVWVPR